MKLTRVTQNSLLFQPGLYDIIYISPLISYYFIHLTGVCYLAGLCGGTNNASNPALISGPNSSRMRDSA